MRPSSLEQIDRDFLQQLYDRTRGDASIKVSMYEIGEAIDLDRDTSSQVAQTLIGLDFVEIKTLSGGIGISPDGVAAIESGGDGVAPPAGVVPALSNARILSTADLGAVEQIIAYLKNEAAGFNLDFEAMAELVADLRTIDAQLSSSRPKTDVVRACLQSIEALMTALGHKEAGSRLRALTGE